MFPSNIIWLCALNISDLSSRGSTTNTMLLERDILLRLHFHTFLCIAFLCTEKEEAWRGMPSKERREDKNECFLAHNECISDKDLKHNMRHNKAHFVIAALSAGEEICVWGGRAMICPLWAYKMSKYECLFWTWHRQPWRYLKRQFNAHFVYYPITLTPQFHFSWDPRTKTKCSLLIYK